MKKYQTIMGENKLEMFQNEIQQPIQGITLTNKTMSQGFQETYVLSATPIINISIAKITSYFSSGDNITHPVLKIYPKIDSVYVDDQHTQMLFIFVISDIDPQNLKNNLEHRINEKISLILENICSFVSTSEAGLGKQNDETIDNQIQNWEQLYGNKKFYQSMVVVEKNGKSLKLIDQTENIQFNYKKMRYRPRRANCQYKSICLGQIHDRNK